MQKKKILKKLLIVLAIIEIITFFVSKIPTFADYGDFESYDSGSSSYDSGSSWSSWDDDYSYSSSSSSSSSSGSGSPVTLVFMLVFTSIIIVVILRSNSKYNKNIRERTSSQIAELERKYSNNRDESTIENQIKETDPLFNKDEFLTWANDLFVKMQYAWSDRNLESIRAFETPEFYEQTNSQVQRYISGKKINKLERVSVNSSKLCRFERLDDREVLDIILDSKMIDYIIDETSNRVLKGNPNTNLYNKYVLTFIRKTGTKTREDGSKVETMNCPNCGAPTEITSSGKCSYCGSIITTDDHGWSLSGLKRIQ